MERPEAMGTSQVALSYSNPYIQTKTIFHPIRVLVTIVSSLMPTFILYAATSLFQSPFHFEPHGTTFIEPCMNRDR